MRLLRKRDTTMDGPALVIVDPSGNVLDTRFPHEVLSIIEMHSLAMLRQHESLAEPLVWTLREKEDADAVFARVEMGVDGAIQTWRT